MKILVCGGRSFGDTPEELAIVHEELSQIFEPGDVLIHGGCRTGADRHAAEWGKANGYEVRAYPVDHSLDGAWPGAGPRRNKRMYLSSKPDMVVAFPGGRGTLNMLIVAKEGNTPHLIVGYRFDSLHRMHGK
jgi:predicted Rossmann-fold nucleotide-binding protein